MCNKVEKKETEEESWPGIKLMSLNEEEIDVWEELAEHCGPIRPCLGLFSDI